MKNAAGTGALRGVGQISVRGIHSCVVLENRTVQCWGVNTSGQLGDGSTTNRYLPVVVKNSAGSGPLVGAVGIASGTYYTCAVMNVGTADCWGMNAGGQLGDGTTTDRHLPVVVKNSAGTGALTGVIGMSAGAGHTCALLGGATAECWGFNGGGQLGDGTTTKRRLPGVVKNPAGTGPLAGVTQISIRDVDSCAVLSDGTVDCWGNNAAGQLGDGTTTRRLLPVPVAMQ